MKGKAKLIVFAVIAALLLAGWGFDSIRAKTFSAELLSVSPDPGVADGQTPVTLRIRVSRGGEPCKGHILYGVSLNGGSFRAKRVATDENGTAEFIYYPYLKSRINQLTDVTLRFTDESNSLFIAVPVELSVVLAMTEPDGENDGHQTNEGMFG